MCPTYVAGLIGPGDRKSVQPMAARAADINYDQLHHFVENGLWDAASLEAVLLAQADSMVGGNDAWLIIDDTSLPKKGTHSVGVAPQYASTLGKNANWQTLVSLTLASREVPVMVGLRLFLPEGWTATQPGWTAPAFQKIAGSIAVSQKSHWQRSTGSGPWASHTSRRSIRLTLQWSFPSQGAAALGSTMCPMQSRQVRRRCWRPQTGARSVGDVAPKALSQLALPLFVSASPMARHSAFTTREVSTCLARRSGLLANIVRPESANTICPTCPAPYHSSSWPVPSRRAGSANRCTSS